MLAPPSPYRSGRGAGGEGCLAPILLALVIALGRPSSALAHDGAPLAPHDLWGAWTVSPLLLGGLAAFVWLYGCGVANGWRKLGRGRVVPVWRVGAFAAATLALGVALVSPLDAMAGALFSAHMAQHLLLVVVAAPLLVASAPPLPLLWSLPEPWRVRVARWSRAPLARGTRRALTIPAATLLLHVATLWLWHLPLLYEAALRNAAVHLVEHVSLIGTALLFWWVLIQPIGRRRASPGVGVFLAFAASLQGTILGTLIAFADMAWYRSYAGSTSAWGVSALDDQRLAGAMMMPAGLAYLIAALVLMTRVLQVTERRGAWGSVPGGAAGTSAATIRVSERGVG